MIRGAIAFGLVLRIPEGIEHRGVIVTTSLTLVIVTTVLYGSLMPLVQKFLVPPKKEDAEEGNEEHPRHSINTNEDEHEEFLHPNMMKETMNNTSDMLSVYNAAGVKEK